MTWTPGALVRLRTKRFTLASIERKDADARLAGWLADPEVMMGLNMPRRRMSRAELAGFAARYDNRRRFCLMIFEGDVGEDSGGDAPAAIGLFTATVDPGHKSAETAVVVGERAHWGRDVVLEGRTALLDFLFDVLEVEKVVGKPHGRNFSSIYNYKALGFKCEAVLREQMLRVDGEARLDQLIFGLLRREWLERRATGGAA